MCRTPATGCKGFIYDFGRWSWAASACGRAATDRRRRPTGRSPERSRRSATARSGSARRPAARRRSPGRRPCSRRRRRSTIGTGIATVWGRDPLTTASAVRTVAEAFPGRFVAGLGREPPPAVEARGDSYDRPLELHARLPRRRWPRPRTQSPEPTVAPTIVLAALRPRMLELAARARRRRPSLLRHRASTYGGPASCSVRTSCSPPSSPSCSEADPGEARRLARLHTGSFYLSAAELRTMRCAGSAGATPTSPTAAPTRWSTRSSRGATSRRSRARVRRVPRRRRRPRVPPAGDRAIRPLVDGPDTAALDVLRRLAPALTALGLMTVRRAVTTAAEDHIRSGRPERSDRARRGGWRVTIIVDSPEFAELVDPDAQMTEIGSGYQFSEGPVWDVRDEALVFSDIPGDARWRWTPETRHGACRLADVQGQRPGVRPRRQPAGLRAD